MKIYAFIISAGLVFPSWAWSQSKDAAQAQPPLASDMDGEMFYQLLLGELNAQGTDPAKGYAMVLNAARKTNNPKLYQRAAIIAINNRDGEAALQAARAWKQAHPESREANRQLLQVLIALNRVSDSAEPLRTEIDLTPAAQRAASLSVIPRNYLRVSDKKLAASTVEKALAEYLNTPDTAAPSWTSVGRMRLDAGDVKGALEAGQRAQAADALAAGPALLAADIMDPKYPQAEVILKKYLQNGKALPEIRMAYARGLIDTLRYAEAAQQIQMVTRDKPAFADAWLVQGSLQVQDNLLTEADASLKRYIELAKQGTATQERQRGLSQAYLSLSQLAEKRKDFALAESWLAKIDNSSALVSTQNRRASILAKQGKLAEGRKLIRALPERNPEDKRTKILSEVELLRSQKHYQEAYELLAIAHAQDPADSELLYDQATMAEKLDRHDEMERLLRKLIASKPDYHNAYNALGYSLAERNQRLPEAKQLIQKALEYAPNDPFITDSLGWVEFRMGNIAQAIKILDAAYKSRPDADIGAHLGEVYWADNQRDKALAIWREAMLLNPENDVLLETLKRLRVKL